MCRYLGRYKILTFIIYVDTLLLYVWIEKNRAFELTQQSYLLRTQF